jgi:hypothetical protein
VVKVLYISIVQWHGKIAVFQSSSVQVIIEITVLLYVSVFIKPVVYIFSKNVGDTLKFKAPEGCHETISILRAYK